MPNFTSAVWPKGHFGSVAVSVSSGTSTKSANGRYVLYGSTGVIGRTEQVLVRGCAILVARVGANAGSIQLVNGEFGVSDNTIVVRLNDKQNYYYWQAFLGHADLNSRVYGSGQPLITGSVIKGLLVQIPNHHEQKAIAKALSDTDALIAALEKLITKKRAIKTATMQQLLTGKTRLPGFGEGKGYKDSELGRIPEDWEVCPLGQLTELIVDGTHYTPRYVDSGVPFYSVESVTRNDFTNTKFISEVEFAEHSRRCNPEKGDLLMTRIGTLGVTRVIDWDVRASIYVSLALLRFRNDYDSSYINSYSKFEGFVKAVEERALLHATPKKINMDAIPTVPVCLPSSQYERNEIASTLDDMDFEITANEKRLQKLVALKSAMMQQLLTGRTRLI